MVGMDQYDSSRRCSSSIPAVAHAGVVLLGFPRAVFLYVVVRPLMLRIKAGMNQKDSDAGLVLLVMLSALCFPDARHLGRYGPEGQVCSMRLWPRSSSNAAVACLAGFAGDDIYAVFPLLLSAGPGCLASWSVWTRWTVTRFPVVHTSTVCNDRCHGLWGAENCGISEVAVHAGRRHFLRCAEADFHGPCDHGDSPVTRGHGGRWPLFAVVQFPVVTQRLVPWSRLSVGPWGFSSCFTRCFDALLCRACWSSTSRS